MLLLTWERYKQIIIHHSFVIVYKTPKRPAVVALKCAHTLCVPIIAIATNSLPSSLIYWPYNNASVFTAHVRACAHTCARACRRSRVCRRACVCARVWTCVRCVQRAFVCVSICARVRAWLRACEHLPAHVPCVSYVHCTKQRESRWSAGGSQTSVSLSTARRTRLSSSRSKTCREHTDRRRTSGKQVFVNWAIKQRRNTRQGGVV